MNHPLVLAITGASGAIYAVRLLEVLLNIVSNAIKYTDKGSIEVSVSRQGKEILFSVKDTGIGIEPG